MSAPGIPFFVGAGLPVLFVGLTYAAGARRRVDAGHPVAPFRHAAFATGLSLLFLSLQWPFAVWAHELFSIHQVGIMVARIVTPMLIALAHPAGLLVTGLPRPIRERLLKPGLSAPLIRQAWRAISQPAPTLALYIGALYFWAVPDAQATALANPIIGLAMHLTLLLTGLLFWTRIFERRPLPHGASHGTRLMMIWLAILSQIALGAYITVKTTVLYHAYAPTELLAMTPPIVDEGRGGFFIWIVSGLLSLLGLIVVVDMWGRHETSMDAKRTRWSSSNSAILLYPTTGHALRAMARPKNRRLAVGLSAFVLLIFAATCGFVTGAHRLNRRENMRLYELSRSS